LPLRPGTNVALINSLAHVVVSEGLEDQAFVEERCDLKAYNAWRDFIAEQRNSPEALETVTGVPANNVRKAARAYATAGNGAIYYGLGVTEHSQGSTMVMGIANLAMATGNIGREGVGVNPLRGQNNVQGSCDMGSFPHELPGYQHIGDDKVRSHYEQVWGVKLDNEPGLRIPNMFDAAIAGSFKALYVQGEDIAQSDPNTQHVESALRSLDCLIVQDIFLNETAKFAHVLLPGSTFLEKNGTFTNAERRINRVRKVMAPVAGKEDWEVTMDLANALRMAPDAATRARVREATRSGLRLLARPQVAEERVLLKPANAAAGLHGTMLELMPESRGVLLFSDLRAFMTSILKKGETGRAFVRTLYNIFSLDGTGLSRIPSRQAMGFTDMQVAALVWRHQMETHAALLEDHGDRLMVLDCEDFLARPVPVLRQLRSHLDLDLSDERIDAVVAGDLLRRNAKFAADDFDATTRRAEAGQVEGQWGEDLDRIGDWARGLTLDRSLQGALAAFGPR
jgi:hypothetical protein